MLHGSDSQMQLTAKSGPPKLFARKMSLASNPEAFDVFDKLIDGERKWGGIPI